MTQNPESKSSWQQALNQMRQAPHPPTAAGQEYQIPWSDPQFSRRMLKVHLDASTHMASRTPQVIGRHVDWLTARLGERGYDSAGCHILDVGCGPGLYLHDLASRGYQTTGIDFAPATLKWAQKEAQRRQLDCRFLSLDLTLLPDDLDHQVGRADAITFWFGEFHSFKAETVRDFLPRLAACLKPGGLFFLEYQPLDWFLQEDSTQWSLQDSSVFCDQPHLWLEEFGWDEAQNAEVHVHWILEQDSGKLTRYVQYHYGWTADQLTAILGAAGLGDLEFHQPITGESDEFEFPLLVARRAGN